jgi:hypothetical protein
MTPGFAFIQRPELPRDNPGYGLPVRDMDGLLRIFDHDRNGIISMCAQRGTFMRLARDDQDSELQIWPGASPHGMGGRKGGILALLATG